MPAFVENTNFPTTNFNLHTHTFRCNHARGDVADYAGEALKNGLSALGMSDHCPLPDDRWNYCMTYREKDEYLAECVRQKEAFAGKGLSIIKGFECDWSSDMAGYFSDLKEQCDYLVLALHQYTLSNGYLSDVFTAWNPTPKLIRRYAEDLIKGMETGTFLFVAHPDLWCGSYLKWDEDAKATAREISEAAVRLGLPLELNGNGWCRTWIDTPTGRRAPYPNPEFWEVASEYGVRAVINSDSHLPTRVAQGFSDLKKLAESLNLTLVSLELGGKKPRLV